VWAYGARAGLAFSSADRGRLCRRSLELAATAAEAVGEAEPVAVDRLGAGHARIQIVRFTVMTTLGCAIWASGFVLAGMLLGTSWQAAGHTLRILLLLLGAAAGCGILWRAHNRKP
jgi:hypothetical protein